MHNIDVTIERKLIYNYIPLAQVREAKVTKPFNFFERVAAPDYTKEKKRFG